MATNYVMTLIDICGKLGVEVPTNIRADQRLTIDLIEQCVSKVNDLAAELEGKVDTSDATATEADIAVGKTAYSGGAKLLGTMVRIANSVTRLLTACEDADDCGFAGHGLDYTSVLTADDGFVLPETITVTMGASELEQGVGFSYDATTGVYVVYAVSDETTITAVATEVPVMHPVTRTLTGCTDTNTDEEVEDGEDHTGVLVADDGFALPETIAVTMGGSELEVDTGYTYVSATGEYTVTAVDGPLTITAVATEGTGD